MGTLDAQAARLGAAVDTILDLRPRVEAAGPWPPAELYGTEAEASWGPAELLAHLDEMLRFWLGEVERIIDGSPDGAPLPFGRTAADPLRIGLIGRDRGVPLRELISRLASDTERVARRMRELAPDEASRRGVHPTVGELDVSRLFERFVTSHIEGHVTQLREILDTRGA